MTPVAATRAGRVRGSVEHGVCAFKGIPFAEPPSGPRAFRPPVPVSPWDGVREATAFGPMAPQPTGGGIFAPNLEAQGDDCLSLNVWTPDPGSTGLPVFFWIHGGGFAVGGGGHSIYSGQTFARDGVVCVTINYRLGAAGFLGVGDEGAGNYGLLDQVAALEWVQENIAAFGGDPGNVTIAGESAGAMSVGVLLATPAARGLFRRAIIESGAAHNVLDPESSRLIAEEFCKLAGVAVGDVDSLRVVPSPRLVELSAIVRAELQGRDRQRFGPVVDTVTPMPFQPTLDGEVLPGPPIEQIAGGSSAGVDLLVFHTTEEMRLFSAAFAEWTDEQVADAFERAFPGDGAAVRLEYARRRPGAAPVEVLCAFLTDGAFRIPAVRLAEAHARHHPATWYSTLSWRTPALGGQAGAAHSLDLPFVWDNLDDPLSRIILGPNPPERLAHEMHGAWVSFMAGGDPNHGALPAWPPYDVDRRAVLDFGDETKVVFDPEPEERRLWDGAL